MKKPETFKKAIQLLSFIVILILPLYVLVKGMHKETAPAERPALYTGAASCVACHLSEYKDWLQSDHRKAMDYATSDTVLGDFNNATLQAQGQTHRFFMHDGKFMVHTDGPDGTMKDFEVKYVFGYTPLQQYLVELPGGRLQTLALTWDCNKKRWYHMADAVYPGQTITHNNWLHWTNQAQNWNSMCADCHSTNLQKNYNPENDTYHTTWSEINVSCEACHGPGSKHLEWAAQPEYARKEIANDGLTVQTSNIDQTAYVNVCVRCHSRRPTLQDFDPAAQSVYDQMIPNLPQEPLWYIDGQIKEEDYVYASFMQSKMHMKEVQCNDCHNVHSGKLLFGTDYNRLCAQCHVADIYDTPTHHFHKTAGMPGERLVSASGVTMDVGSGSLCINCHMPARYYMGVDYRRDHSFRIPRPDLSSRYGVPNACNQCHTDKSSQWSEDYISTWFGTSRRFHFSEALRNAQRGNQEANSKLHEIAYNELYPVNVRALAIQYQGTYFQSSFKKDAGNYLHLLEPALRIAAVRALQIQTPEDQQLLLPLLNDATKAVRTETARILLALGEDHIPAEKKEDYLKAKEEYKQALLYSADFPMGKYNLGNFYFHQGMFEQARDCYLKALQQDKDLHFIKLNLATCYNRLQQNDTAAHFFEDYLQHAPEDAQAMYSYGLLLSEMKEYDHSLQVLLKSYALDASRPRVAHNIAMLYDFQGDTVHAEAYLKKEASQIQSFNSKAELLRFYLGKNMPQKALLLAKQLVQAYPDMGQQLDPIIKNLQGK